MISHHYQSHKVWNVVRQREKFETKISDMTEIYFELRTTKNFRVCVRVVSSIGLSGRYQMNISDWYENEIKS